MVLIARLRHRNPFTMLIIRRANRAVSGDFTDLRLFPIVIASSVKGSNLLREALRANGIRGSLVPFHRFKDFFRERPPSGIQYRVRKVPRLTLNVTKVRVRSLCSSFHSNNVRILGLRLARFAAIRNVYPNAARLLSVGRIYARSSFFVQVGTRTSFSVFSFEVFLRVSRHLCSFHGTNFVVHARRDATINGGRVLSRVFRRFKGLAK